MNARIPLINAVAVEDDLRRLLASRVFARAARLRELLRYIVAAALADETHRLRETSIALDVFRRDPARFDPARDPIVRVSANRLRALLDRYYASEGVAADWQFELVAGSYIPVIRRRAPWRVTQKPRVAVAALADLDGDATQRIVRALGVDLAARDAIALVAAPDADGALHDGAPAPDVIVRAGVVRSAGPLAVTAEARVAHDGSLLWRLTFEPPDGDEHVLTWRLVDLTLRSFDTVATPAPAFDAAAATGAAAYLIEQARHLNATQMPDNLVRAEALALQATQQAPRSADAWFVLAMVRFSKLAAWGAPGGVTLAAAHDALDRAIGLDARHAPALSLSAYLTVLRTWRWHEGQHLAERAVDLAPDHAGVVARLAYLMLARGRPADAHALYLRCVTCDPFAPPARTGVAMALAALGRHDEALQALDQAERIIGPSWYLTDVRLHVQVARGDFATACEAAGAWRREQPASVPATVRLAQARAGAGDIAAARALLGEIAASGNPLQRPYLRLLVEACGPDPDAAFAAARDALAAGSPGCPVSLNKYQPTRPY
jgi:tetratricopeptide (TPR) repeat protein